MIHPSAPDVAPDITPSCEELFGEASNRNTLTPVGTDYLGPVRGPGYFERLLLDVEDQILATLPEELAAAFAVRIASVSAERDEYREMLSVANNIAHEFAVKLDGERAANQELREANRHLREALNRRRAAV